MTAKLLADMDESVVHKARTPKGMRALQSILDATYELVNSQGLAAASQDAIAKRANLTQSAVRYYFPKKDDLLHAFFLANIKRMEAQFKQELANEERDAHSHLIRIVALHCDRVLAVEDVFYFETAAYWSRNPGYRKLRNDWYILLSGHYSELVQQIHPDWDTDRCTATAFQIITLILGSWSTMGSSRAVYPRLERKTLKAMLLDGIEKLIA